jgi:hypothetical protein
MASDTKWTVNTDTSAWRGVSWGDATGTTTTSKTRADPCCDPCPDCGGLECYCRPRFFAGQLLTEKELNGLQDYVIAKNKLHNRHLVGAGIVCGLEAQCDPCGDRVRVTTGYAISPCGEDIVVCKPDSVDVCALIAKCRETDEPDCRPYAPGKDDCADVIEDWVLTIRYAEAPSRNEPPTTAKGSCGCGGSGSKGGCGCGGSGSKGGCGCGCSSTPAKSVTNVANSAEPVLRRGAPPACVPQYTCESYRYDVFRLPDEKPRDPQRDPAHLISGALDGLEGPFIERLRCCLREIEDAVPPLPSGSANDAAFRQQAVRWICDVRNNLKRLLMRRGGHDCSLIDRLMAIPIPPTDNQQTFEQTGQIAVQELFIILFEMMLECLCSAMLPSCPEAEDPRIPIAVVKVRRGNCEIISVCNWTPLRRQLVTWPAMNYWLGWLPQITVIREYIHLMCCETFGLFDNVKKYDVRMSDDASGEEAPKAAAASPEMAEARTMNTDHQGINAGTTFMARSLASVMAKRASGMPVFDAGAGAISDNDLMALLAGPRGAQTTGPRLDAASRVFAGLVRPLREAAPIDAMTAPLGVRLPGAAAQSSSDLGAEIAALRKTIAEQNDRIAVLETAAPKQAPAVKPRRK